MSVFSGTAIYESTLYQLFNILFTSFPVMYYALYDFEYTKEELLKNPKYYRIGIRGKFHSHNL